MTTGHVLLVADAYRAQPDSRSYTLSHALSTVGWNVSVLTASPGSAVRESSRARDGDLVRVINVPTPTHPTDPILNAWPAARHRDPQTWATKDQTARAASWFDDELALWRPRLDAIDMTALPTVGTDRDEWRWMVGNSTFRWCADMRLTNPSGFSFDHIERWTPEVLSGVLSEWNRQI